MCIFFNVKVLKRCLNFFIVKYIHKKLKKSVYN